MLLCIDSGNSKTKWAVFNGAGEIVDFGSGLNSELGDLAFPSASEYQRIIVSNVAGATHQASITRRLGSNQAPMHTVQSPAVMAGLRNHYQVAQALGSDRFARRKRNATSSNRALPVAASTRDHQSVPGKSRRDSDSFSK
jgi:type III pantothenate kinase